MTTNTFTSFLDSNPSYLPQFSCHRCELSLDLYMQLTTRRVPLMEQEQLTGLYLHLSA